ncbi:GNAT family N-acetyltransferase [Reinekea marina]|uniref:GNAT family N-acetyltransferase n=1 Tax=Reinekea marina TaxID=1310421 RepID=A0ABV7WR48_9GAMM|nr:bifunctional acetate--CoA ligase family protein/GNAT family N-acetyltransferase [Reinekea marina]MDN3650297.1 GNAT family N-acetyltransferase [Reinekea marina]MDN3651091.1 GNAT family N-acetyltransferase [Reinekea marina]
MPNLTSFFYPKSIAVIGASEREDSLGGIVIKNLQDSGYDFPITGVNLKGYKQVHGIPCVRYLRELQTSVDLVIICVPGDAITSVLRQMGRKKLRSAMILTGGMARQLSQSDTQNRKIRHLAKELGIRVLGPNCLGILVPDHHLNASYTHIDALPGHAAYVGHSAALGSALLDWAGARGIGFSHFLTVGASADLRISDFVDYLASDRRVKAILVHLEQIRDSNRLLIALRAASRSKKVLAIRTRPNNDAPAGIIDITKVDDEYFSRAGVLKVDTLNELFSGLEFLSRAKPIYRRNLTIVSNGLGTALMARQFLESQGGELAQFKLNTTLSKMAWYQKEVSGNPIVLPTQAQGNDYLEALKQLEQIKEVGVILVIHSPNRATRSVDFSQTLLPYLKRSRRLILTCFLGGLSTRDARQSFDGAGLLSFDTPTDAVDAYLTLAKYQSAQEQLRETPSSDDLGFVANVKQAKALLYKARKANRDYLTWPESRQLLRLYGFNLVDSLFDVDFKHLVNQAHQRYFPAALRIIHETYSYPFAYQHVPAARWRGAKTDIPNREALMTAQKELAQEKQKRLPHSKVLGYSIQPMRRKVDALQYSIGITRDETYGPLVFFGGGGSHANMLADRQVSLAPLNSTLAKHLILKSQSYQVLLERSEDVEGDVTKLIKALITLSQMVIDLPRLKGVEVNLLLQNDQAPLVLGVAVDQGEKIRPALNPYPVEYEETVKLKDARTVVIRPIKGEDEPMLKNFMAAFDAESLRLRFFYSRMNFEHLELATMSQIDYRREMVFIAVDHDTMLGEQRLWFDINNNELEFAIMVAPLAQGTGLASRLMQKTVSYAQQIKASKIVADILPENTAMLGLANRFGFEFHHEEEVVRAEKIV